MLKLVLVLKKVVVSWEVFKTLNLLFSFEAYHLLILPKEIKILKGISFQKLSKWFAEEFRSLTLNTSMLILHTFHHTILKVLTRIVFLIIVSFPS